MALTDLIGGLDFLSGGLTTLVLVVVLVLALWQFKLFHILLWPFKAIWWITSAPFRIFRGGTPNFSFLGKRLQDALGRTNLGEEAAIEGKELQQMQQQEENIDQALQILRGKDTLPQKKVQAVLTVLKSQRQLLNQDKRTFKRLSREYKKDAADEARVLKDMKQMIRAEKKMEGISLKETETITEHGGQDPTGGTIIQIIQTKLIPLEEKVMALEAQARGKSLELKRVARNRVGEVKETERILKEAEDYVESVIERKELLTNDIYEISGLLRTLRKQVDQMLRMTQASIALNRDRKAIITQAKNMEGQITAALAELDKAILAHKAAKAQDEAKTSLQPSA